MSKDVQTKSQRPVRDLGTLQKSLDANNDGSKAVAVKALHFSQLVRWPGLGGSFTSLVVGKPEVGQLNSANLCFAESIFEYKGRFCVNGRFWVPETAGALLSWEY